MSNKRFEVEKYQVTLGPDLPSIITNKDVKVVGIIGCFGKDAQLMLNFVESGSFLPDAVYNKDTKTGAVFLPVSIMPSYVDLLRNEKPIYAYCNSEKPEWTNISTSHEPTGEEEGK